MSGGSGGLVRVGLGIRLIKERENRQNIKNESKVQQTDFSQMAGVPVGETRQKAVLKYQYQSNVLSHLVSTAVY